MATYTVRGQGEDQGDPLFFMTINGDSVQSDAATLEAVVEAVRDAVAARADILVTEVIKYTTTTTQEVIPPTP